MSPRSTSCLDTLGATLEPVYGFRSLHAFKASSSHGSARCTWSSATRRDLPRIGIAITRAYLPTAGLGDMLTVVKG